MQVSVPLIVHVRADGDSLCTIAIATSVRSDPDRIITATAFPPDAIVFYDLVIYHETGDSQPVATWHIPNECKR